MVRQVWWLRMMPIVFVLVAMTAESGGVALAESNLFISADGILDEQLMPITYLILDGATEESRGSIEPERAEGRMENPPSNNDDVPSTNASYASALSMLGFHRTMINLYRCKGFLAKRILETYPMQPLLLKRMSAPSGARNFSTVLTTPGTPHSAMDAMLYDQGSSGYKEWLTKTSTLDDIHENFLLSARVSSATGNRSAAHPQGAGLFQPVEATPISSPRLSQDEYFDEGIITGYAIQPDGPLAISGERNLRAAASGGYIDRALGPYRLHRDLLEGEAPGYEASRGDFAFRHHHHHPLLEYEEKSLDKGLLGLKDLFDIALTTLAFLSFGMFILQVIMCITMTKTDTGMMILPTPTDVEVEEEERRRFTRDLPDAVGISRDAVREQNRIAAYVLESIDISVDAGPGRDACLQTSLCEANRFSRMVTSIHGYWISVWSFGVSWLSGCKTPACSSPVFALKCLSATLTGLGAGDCIELYPCSARQTARM